MKIYKIILSIDWHQIELDVSEKFVREQTLNTNVDKFNALKGWVYEKVLFLY